MRKKHGDELYVYVVDRLYRSSDVVSACKYMNKLRRRVLPSETQKDIVRAHKDQYVTRWKTFPSGVGNRADSATCYATDNGGTCTTLV